MVEEGSQSKLRSFLRTSLTKLDRDVLRQRNKSPKKVAKNAHGPTFGNKSRGKNQQ